MKTVLTSFSPRGYIQYGHRFLDTFRKYWPKDVQLLIYHEGQPQLGGYDLLSQVEPCIEFIQRHKTNLAVQGKSRYGNHYWKNDCLRSGYNFRFDAYKFSRKIFAIEHAMSLVKTGKLFWVDADVVTFDVIPQDFLDRQLPDDVCTSYLGRVKGYHSECGFVGYNLNQERCHEFITKFAALYKTDAFMNLAEWHDSWVYDYVRGQTDIPAKNLSAPNSSGHVFIQSELGLYMDHLKGDRKILGRSHPVNNPKAPHNHPYWRNS